MTEIVMEDMEIKRKTRAIVCFGPMTETTGARPGTFFQVTIDPNMVSPGNNYIRFDQRAEDEIHGWQIIEALTVCEVLEELEPDPKGQSVTIRAVVKE